MVVVDLADLLPINAIFLHLIRDEAAIAQLEGDFLDVVGAEDAHEGDQVRDSEVLDL